MAQSIYNKHYIVYKKINNYIKEALKNNLKTVR